MHLLAKARNAGKLSAKPASDADVPPDRTDADLEKFDVPFGRRKRLIEAMAKWWDVTALSNRGEPFSRGSAALHAIAGRRGKILPYAARWAQSS